MNTIKSFSTSPRQSGLLLKGSSFVYTDQNNFRQLISISPNSIQGLTREKSAHLYSMHRELFSLRRDLANDFMNPIINAIDKGKNLERFIAGYKRNSLSSILSDTELLMLHSINRSVNLSSSRLRSIGIEVDTELHSKRVESFSTLMRRDRVIKSLSSLFDRAEQHALSYARNQISKNLFKQRVLDSSFTPTQGGSLTKGIRKVRRTEYQQLDHAVSRGMYVEHGINYCYWRLSGNHKDYGGKEVCEVLANATGSRAANSSLSTRGLYHINEFPSVPHPNCMCQMIPAKET